MPELRPLNDHRFRVTTNDHGDYVGTVIEFPELRTRPHKRYLNALDDIVTQTRNKLRDLEDALNPITKAMPR